MLVTNEVFTTNKFDSIEGSNKSIEKYKKLSKTRKLSKSRNLKGNILSKSKKYLLQKYAFTFLRLYLDWEKWFFEIFNIKLTMQSFWPCLGFHNLKTL